MVQTNESIEIKNNKEFQESQVQKKIAEKLMGKYYGAKVAKATTTTTTTTVSICMAVSIDGH